MSVPKPLQEVLGDEGTTAFVEVLNRQQDQMTDDIARAVVRALEPRFASIEARLDQCATKDELVGVRGEIAGLATKGDLAECAKGSDVDRLSEKQEAFAVALERGLGGIRADMAGFATRDDLAGFAKQSAVDRLSEKQEAFAVALERGLGGIRAGMAEQIGGIRGDMASQLGGIRGDMAGQLGGIRADMAAQRADMMKWMFIFWVGQAFVVLAYLRAAQQ